MIFHKLIAGQLNTNSYLFIDEETQNCVLFDPTDDPMPAFELINSHNYKLKKIILTHAHIDHALGTKFLKIKTGAEVIASEGAPEIFKTSLQRCREMPQFVSYKYPVKHLKVDRYIKDNEKISEGNLNFLVISTPGHTIDSASFLIDDILISGDTLFYNAIGRTDLETGCYEQEISSIKNKLFKLDDNTKVYPGHGWKTTIKFEKENNKYI